MGRRRHNPRQDQQRRQPQAQRYENVLADEQQEEEVEDEEQATSSSGTGTTTAPTAVPSVAAPAPMPDQKEMEQQQQQQQYDEADADSDGSHHHHTHHHHIIPKRKFVYVASLLLALWMIQSSTESSFSFFQIVQQHEPSVRIFRSLLETVLVLLGTAASVAVWRRYLGHDTTAELLFQPATVAASSLSPSPPSHFDNNHDHHTRSRRNHRSNNSQNTKNDDDATVKEDSCDSDSDSADLFENVYDDDDSHNSDNDDGIAILEDTTLRIPSPWWITGVALDLLIWILIALVLYTISAVHAISTDHPVGQVLSRMAAPTFPLLLFVLVLVRSLHPWRPYRRPLWQVLYWTWSAPAYPVTFRDGLIGDVLTSTVRPLQDVAFTMFYILFGLRGWYSQQYFFPNEAVAQQSERWFVTLQEEQVLMEGAVNPTFVDAADATVPVMETSWIVHTVVLPACMISPLWWRFLQNMRQVYDQQQRWPYLGNALKYFAAASVAMTGVYHPHLQSSAMWLTCFVVATLYQIWWDLFMDWGLFVRNATTGRWQLRSQRLYPNQSIYWLLTIINTLLRFCWTLSFVPLRYLSAAGVLQENFSGDTWSSILAPTIASAEIIRRTLWGLLRVEWEAIKRRAEEGDSKVVATGSSKTRNMVDDDHHHEPGAGGLEMIPMKLGGGRSGGTHPAPYSSSLSLTQRLRQMQCRSDMSSMSQVQILAELCLYTTAFAVVGLVAAAHRETL